MSLLTRTISLSTRSKVLLFAITLTASGLGFTLFGGVQANAQGCNGNPSYVGNDQSCTDIGGAQQNPAQVVLTANPSSIQAGTNSLLSWGSDNSSSYYPYQECVIDHGVGTVQTAGSVTVSPTVTTTYTINCSRLANHTQACGNTNCIVDDSIYTSANATVTVTPAPTLVASCSVSPSSIQTNGSATWQATVSGGNGSYTYSWSGTDGLSGSTSNVTKSYPTAGTKTGSVTVTSAAQTITQTCGSGLTVATPLAADITPTGLTPTTVIAQQASVFTASMFNGGNAPTPSFSSTVYVCQTGDTACQNSILAVNTTQSRWGGVLSYFYKVAHAAASVNLIFSRLTVAAGATGTQTSSYTFASPGTYQMRLCGDLPNNEVAESNENNNCGSWQVLTVCPSGNTVDGSGNCVPPVPGAPTCSLTATPSNSVPSTLAWSSTGATTCSGSGGGFATGNATTGSVSVGSPGTYVLNCTGAGGSCSTATDVSGGTCSGVAAVTITAAPNRVRAGQPSTIAWTATNVPGASPSCTISGPGMATQTIPAGTSPTCAIPNSSATPTINGQSVYTITCGGVSKTVTVNVIPKFVNF
jgi:hypothetical protein